MVQFYALRWRIVGEASPKGTVPLHPQVGGTNGIKIQINATWTFYAVLNDLCAAAAWALNQPIEMISVEMVFRRLYHYAQAKQREDETELIPFLVKFHKSFGLIKAKRKQRRQKQARSIDI